MWELWKQQGLGEQEFQRGTRSPEVSGHFVCWGHLLILDRDSTRSLHKAQAWFLRRVSTEGKRNPARLLMVMWGWCNRMETWEACLVTSYCKLSSSGDRYWIWGLHLEAYWEIISATLVREQENQGTAEEVEWWNKSGLSQSPRDLWGWDSYLEMSTTVAGGLDLWARINQSLDARCPWGWGCNLGWIIFLQSNATLREGCSCEPAADNNPGSWGDECFRPLEGSGWYNHSIHCT